MTAVGGREWGVRNIMKKTQKVLLFTRGPAVVWVAGNGGRWVSTVSLGPVIDDAVRVVPLQKMIFFFHILGTSAKGVFFSGRPCGRAPERTIIVITSF